jgi:hypothetical protein
VSNPQSIEFRVLPSPETNDFEVRIFVDGRDLIEKHLPGMMGADPDDVLSFEHLAPRDAPHETMIARCDCGIVGCGSVAATVSSEGDCVIWDVSGGYPRHYRMVFEREQYLRALGQAIGDKSWETQARTAARLLSSLVDRDALAAHDLKYDWASDGNAEGMFTVSLLGPPSHHQVLVHTAWRGESPEQMAQTVAALLREHPSQWPEVTWFGPTPALPFDGPGWRKFPTGDAGA